MERFWRTEGVRIPVGTLIPFLLIHSLSIFPPLIHQILWALPLLAGAGNNPIPDTRTRSLPLRNSWVLVGAEAPEDRSFQDREISDNSTETTKRSLEPGRTIPPTFPRRKGGFCREDWRWNVGSSWGRRWGIRAPEELLEPASGLLHVTLSRGGAVPGLMCSPIRFLGVSQIYFKLHKSTHTPFFWSPQPNCPIQLTLLEFSQSTLHVLNMLCHIWCVYYLFGPPPR